MISNDIFEAINTNVNKMINLANIKEKSKMTLNNAVLV